MKVIMIPSVSGGLGHLGRTSALGRELQRRDPAVEIEYVLDAERLRPFNVDAARATGWRTSVLPIRTRDARTPIVQAMLGHADVIVEDTQRHLIPLRRLLPRAAWVSIPMVPLWDEVFMEWPLLERADAVLWAYPPGFGVLPELEPLGTKLHSVGPFTDLGAVPERAEARRRLGVGAGEEIVVYSPRGMSFGRDFGERVLGSVFGAVEELRAERPGLRLVLLSVRDLAELRCPGVPPLLPDWIMPLPPSDAGTALAWIRAADLAVTEGSNMTFEAAALGTPVLMVPGTIYETWLLGTRLNEAGAARVIWIERVTPAAVAGIAAELLGDGEERARMTAAARAFAGSSGLPAAADLVLALGRASPDRRGAAH